MFARPLCFLLLAVPVALGQEDRKLAVEARTVLKQHCFRCHNGPGSESGYEFNVLDRGSLLVKYDDLAALVPKQPADSRLHVRAAVDKTMPPRSTRERPSADELAALKRWIDAGAPDFPKDVARKFIPLDEALSAVLAHLRKAQRVDRPYLRYFTLTHLHNNPAVDDADLNLHRAALSKALNSLSWQNSVSPPEAIDAAETLFAIDLRKYGWDRSTWNAVLKQYPYGVRWEEHPDQTLRDLDRDLSETQRDSLPLVRADWFAVTATRPPLYHTMLYDNFLPTLKSNPRRMTARDLEEYLKVDVARNFNASELARGGFARSGVSGQNRLVERHTTPFGAYWKSYDFKPDAGRAKLTRFPLGPLNLFPPGKHPYERQAFVHDGGEIIFNLPNKLQAYLLIDGTDNRIDEGPIQVVSDVLKTSGTPAIVNGVSCMACHKLGTIPFTDTIRDDAAVFGAAEEKVRRLYPEAKVMAESVEEDQRRFLEPLDKVIGKFLRVGADRDRKLIELREPVGEVSKMYRLQYLDLRTLACELDLKGPDELVKRVGTAKLKEMGLKALLPPAKGVIGRFEWEAVDGHSLMQQLALELGCTPTRR